MRCLQLARSESPKKDGPTHGSLWRFERLSGGQIFPSGSPAVPESALFGPEIPARDLHRIARIDQHIRNRNLAAMRTRRQECPKQRIPEPKTTARSKQIGYCSTSGPRLDPRSHQSHVLAPG